MITDSIKKYEKITGETFLHSPDLALKVIGECFMLWKLGIREGVPFFWIDQCYARSFSIFVTFIKEVCQTAEIEIIATATTRNPKSHIRKWKMQNMPTLDYEYEGRHYYLLVGNIENLK